MDTPDELLRETALHIELLFGPDSPDRNEFLNYSQTLRLVQNCSILCTGNELRKQDTLIILLAAWFEYTGVLNDHENFHQFSAENASRYFTEKGLNKERVEEIMTLILATRHPQQPLSMLEQILCDACNVWMAKMNDETYRQDVDSLNSCFQRLENHVYFTPYSRKIFDKPKDKNRMILKEKLRELNTEHLSFVNNNPRAKDDSKLPASSLNDSWNAELKPYSEIHHVIKCT
jgi:hypothetical protein